MVSVEEAVAVLSEGIAAETEQWWTHASSSHANAAQISGDFAKADIAVSERFFSGVVRWKRLLM